MPSTQMQEEEKEERKRQLFANVMQVAVINKLLPQGFRFELIDTQAKLQDGYSQVKPVKRKKVSIYPQMVKSDRPPFLPLTLFQYLQGSNGQFISCYDSLDTKYEIGSDVAPTARAPIPAKNYYQKKNIFNVSSSHGNEKEY